MRVANDAKAASPYTRTPESFSATETHNHQDANSLDISHLPHSNVTAGGLPSNVMRLLEVFEVLAL